LRNPKAKGTRAENELANILWEEGFAVVRGPSSGGGSKKRFQPDLVAVREGAVIAIEVKARSDEGPIYIEAEQVLGLAEFARRAGGKAFIAYRFHPVEGLQPTGSSFKIEDPLKGLRLRDFLELILRRHKDLSDYMRDGAVKS